MAREVTDFSPEGLEVATDRGLVQVVFYEYDLKTMEKVGVRETKPPTSFQITTASRSLTRGRETS